MNVVKSCRSRVGIASLLFLFLTTAAFSGTTGQLCGHVVDEEGSPLPLICMMIHQGSDEPITEDAVGRLLAPFHIGPDR